MMKRFLNKIRGEILFPLGILFLMATFFFATKSALHRFSFYSLSPYEEETETLVPKKALSATASGEENVAPDAPYITDTRTVKESHGILGIYDCFDNLLETFDIDLTRLPIKDRELLREGVVFASEGEARDFLESFDS